MKVLIASLVMTFALVATPALAQDTKFQDDTDADLRCLAVVVVLISQTQDPATTQALNLTGAYYIGRLDGRTPDLDLENRLEALLPSINANMIATERTRCGQMLEARGQVIQQIGADIARHEQQGSKTSPRLQSKSAP